MEETSLSVSQRPDNVVIYTLNLKTGLSDQLGGTSASEQTEPELLERLCEGEQVGLVVDRQQGFLSASVLLRQLSAHQWGQTSQTLCFGDDIDLYGVNSDFYRPGNQ